MFKISLEVLPNNIIQTISLIFSGIPCCFGKAEELDKVDWREDGNEFNTIIFLFKGIIWGVVHYYQCSIGSWDYCSLEREAFRIEGSACTGFAGVVVAVAAGVVLPGLHTAVYQLEAPDCKEC